MNINKLTLSLLLASGLSGCFGTKLDNDQALMAPPVLPEENEVAVSGSAVKGPLAYADVLAYKIDYTQPGLKGELVATGKTDGKAAIYNINLDPIDAPFLLIVSANQNTKDITTNAAPVITELRSIITADQLTTNTPIFATPLTSMAVNLASNATNNAELASELANAQTKIKSTLGFGVLDDINIFTDTPLLTNQTTTDEQQEKVAHYRFAIEAVSAIANNAAQASNADTNATEVLTALANDLSDGVLNNKNGSEVITVLSDINITETAINELKIPGLDQKVIDIESIINNETAITGAGTKLPFFFDVEDNIEEIALSADSDNDGHPDQAYQLDEQSFAQDNCPTVPNENQTDLNNNGIGAACEIIPTVDAITLTTPEDTPLTITLMGYDGADSNDELVYTVNGEVQPGNTYQYTPPTNFHGSVETINYTVSDGEHSSTASTMNITVTPVNDPVTGAVTISGNFQLGETLTAMNTLSDIDGEINNIRYQWKAGDNIIEGATGEQLVLTLAEVNNAISVQITYDNDDNTNIQLDSSSTTPIESIEDTIASGNLTISGNNSEGETLTVDTSNLADINGDIEILSYQWSTLDNSDAATTISGATSSSLLLLPEFNGLKVRITVQFQDSLLQIPYSRIATTETTITGINIPATGTVVIDNDTNNLVAGTQYTATTSNLADGNGLTNPIITFNWYIGDSTTPIHSGETYTPNAESIGENLRIAAIFEDDQANTETLEATEVYTISAPAFIAPAKIVATLVNETDGDILSGANDFHSYSEMTCNDLALKVTAYDDNNNDVTNNYTFEWSSADSTLNVTNGIIDTSSATGPVDITVAVEGDHTVNDTVSITITENSNLLACYSNTSDNLFTIIGGNNSTGSYRVLNDGNMPFKGSSENSNALEVTFTNYDALTLVTDTMPQALKDKIAALPEGTALSASFDLQYVSGGSWGKANSHRIKLPGSQANTDNQIKDFEEAALKLTQTNDTWITINNKVNWQASPSTSNLMIFDEQQKPGDFYIQLGWKHTDPLILLIDNIQLTIAPTEQP